MKKLKEITSKINSGKTPLGGEAVYTEDGIFFIRSQNVNNDTLDFENQVFISEVINNGMQNSVVKSNDILLNITGASLGRSCVVPENFSLGNVNQHVCIIRTINNYNPRFIQPFLSSKKGQEIFKSLQTGSGREGLNFESIKNIKLSYPVLEEQNKISLFILYIDNRIQTQKKIIEGLQTLMRGNLEKVFYQKLRFKNKQGNYFSDWKTIKLDEICDIKKGEQLNKEDLTETGNYPCLNGGMSFSGYTDKFNSNENTITISEGGNSCGFVSFMKSKFWLGGHCYKIILKKDISTDFFFHLLKFYEREIMNLRVGSGLPNIQQKDLKNLQLLVSQDIEEQTKIADFLSSIQEKIEIEKQILERLELQKKFLLTNLFV